MLTASVGVIRGGIRTLFQNVREILSRTGSSVLMPSPDPCEQVASNKASAYSFREILGEHRVLIGLVFIYWLASLLVANFYQIPRSRSPDLDLYFLVALFIPLIFALCWHTISVMLFVRPERLTLYLIADLRRYLTLERVLYAAPVILLIPIFTSTFSFFKSAIPLINPFSWDMRLTEWDSLIHGGTHPWVLLQGVLGNPAVTSTINFFYHLWFFVMYAILTLQAFDRRNPELRMQFLLSFMVSWVLLGTLGAIFFSSMGPCYYPSFNQESGPYAPLMRYLHEASKIVPVWALDVQQMLWDDYQHNKSGIGRGISAMPSMHVATSVLLALFGWRYSRQAGTALTLFAVVIMIGSVHLGWHYALDGYVGALGAVGVWWLVGRLLARRRA
jgi:membrane-associated phospholipid phosphatase